MLARTPMIFLSWLVMLAKTFFVLSETRIPGTLSHRGLWIFADNTLEALRDKVVNLLQEAKAIQARADGDARDVTPEEATTIDQLFAAIAATKAEIVRRERLQSEEQALNTVLPRRTMPSDAPIEGVRETQVAQPRAQITGGTRNDAGTHGFRSLGEMAQKVVLACTPGGLKHADPRLFLGPQNAAPTSFGSENVGEDGGFAVPPDFRAEILKKVEGEDSLMQYCDRQISSSNSFTIPVDETTPWQTSGGVQAFWEGEAAQIAASKMELQSKTVRLNKLAALVPVTDELMEDANSLGNYLRMKAPDKIQYKINDAIVNGTGAGQPQGVLNAPSLVTQAAEGGQATATIVFANIEKMWSRMYGKLRRNAIWLMNQDIEPQLQQMVVTGTASVGFPAYLPPGGLSGQQYSTLLGRPLVPTEACATLGTVGDLILVDLGQYLCVTKASGMRQDISIHLWFDYDITAFRFIIRVGGQSWWTTSIARRNGTNRLGHAIALATRP